MNVPVLMYHAVMDELEQASDEHCRDFIYTVSVETFKQQMAFLSNDGFQTFLIHELFLLDTIPEKAVVITFDDGHISNYLNALPVLESHNFRAEFLITTSWIGLRNYLSKEQIRMLHLRGMSIGSHSMSHPYLDDISEEDVIRELESSKRDLEDIIGREIEIFSAPGGRFTRRVLDLASRCGYKYFCTSTPSACNIQMNSYEIPRFAVRRETDMSELKRIVALKLTTRIRIWIVYSLLRLMKGVLGNKRYEQLRAIVSHRVLNKQV